MKYFYLKMNRFKWLGWFYLGFENNLKAFKIIIQKLLRFFLSFWGYGFLVTVWKRVYFGEGLEVVLYVEEFIFFSYRKLEFV